MVFVLCRRQFNEVAFACDDYSLSGHQCEILSPDSGATPSHTDMSEDIWRPGGSLDRESEGGDDGMDDEDGWGTSNLHSSQEQDHPFGDSSGDNGGKLIFSVIYVHIEVVESDTSQTQPSVLSFLFQSIWMGSI